MSQTTLNHAPPQYYRLMGQSPFAGTTLGAILSWAAVTVLAALYAYADLYIKVVDKLSVLILIAFAVAMGFAVAGILRVTKVRNLVVIAVIALTSAALALYVSWVVWETALARRAGFDVMPWALFAHPQDVWDFARDINGTGTFRMRDKDIVGTELWLFWGAEAATIFGCTLLIPLLTPRRSAFCESCSNWCSDKKHLGRVQVPDEALLREHLEDRDIEYLAGLAPADEDAVLYHSVERIRCGRCGETNLLTVNRVAVTYKNGQRADNAKPVIDRLWLNPAEAATVESLPERRMAAAMAAAASGSTEPGEGVPEADADAPDGERERRSG